MTSFAPRFILSCLTDCPSCSSLLISQTSGCQSRLVLNGALLQLLVHFLGFPLILGLPETLLLRCVSPNISLTTARSSNFEKIVR
jgi:hypothetical protein